MNAQVFCTWFCGHVCNGTQGIPPGPGVCGQFEAFWAYSYFLAPESGAAVRAHAHHRRGRERAERGADR